MPEPESSAPVSPSLLPKFQALLALHEPNTPFDAPGPHFDALQRLPPSELPSYLNWATHLPPGHQPLAQPSHGPTPLSLAEYASRIRDLQPLDGAKASTFQLHTQSTIGGTKPPDPLPLGVRHGPDGREAGRIALKSQHCPWPIRDARDIDPRGDMTRRDELLRLSAEAGIQPGTRVGIKGSGRVGVYLGELVESEDGGATWKATAGHLFVAVDAAYSADLDSPIFVVRDRNDVAAASENSAGQSSGAGMLALPHEPALPTVAELVRALEEAAENSQRPAPTAVQAALAVEDGDPVSVWVVRTEDLRALGLIDEAKTPANLPQQHTQPENTREETAATTHDKKSVLSRIEGMFSRHKKQ